MSGTILQNFNLVGHVMKEIEIENSKNLDLVFEHEPLDSVFKHELTVRRHTVCEMSEVELGDSILRDDRKRTYLADALSRTEAPYAELILITSETQTITKY